MSSQQIIKGHFDWFKANDNSGTDLWIEMVFVYNSKNGPAGYGIGDLFLKTSILGSFLIGDFRLWKDNQETETCPVGPLNGGSLKVSLHLETGTVKIGTKKLVNPKGESGIIFGFIESAPTSTNPVFYVIRFKRVLVEVTR